MNTLDNTSSLDTSKQLQAIIIERIQQSPNQRITFSDFMDLALYHPQFGYYATPGNIIGPQGDFVTSPHMGHDFGELIAEQFADMWVALGKPERFTVIEMGAGQGLVAVDAIAHLKKHHPDCFATLNYIIVEKSPALRIEQQKRLNHWQQEGLLVEWRSLEEIESDAIVGCAFSNELVDAFPVHLVELQDRTLQEVWLAYTDEGFSTLTSMLSTERLNDYFELVNIDFADYPDGYRTEVNLAALDWLTQVSDKLSRGYLLTIDYGYIAERYYSKTRSEGTLQCYYRHSYHNNPFIHIGEQDLTAHVDFTALEQKGDALGLEKLGFTQQGLFLMALGLGDRLSALANTQSTAAATAQDIQKVMMRRDALQQLISPMGLGNFGVLIQGKGLTQTEIARPLKGLTTPPMF